MYQIDIDNRLGSIVSTTGTKASISFVDDDNIATYFLSLGTDTEFVEENTDNCRSSRNNAEVYGTIIIRAKH